MPNKKEIESIRETTQNFKEKIENILSRIKSYKNEIQERFVKLNDYLNFLKLTVNERILKDFNYLYFDYYNYKNFKYLSNYLNTEEILQNDNFIKYLAFGKYSDKIKTENKEDITESNNIILDNNQKNKDDIKIDYCKELIYLKDNLFIQFSNFRENTIKLFEFKYKSFNHILSYSFNDSGRVHSIKPAKYNNNIMINFNNKKNIKIIEYDIDNKTMSLIKNQIKTSKSLSDRFFISYIDDKKGNIITSDENDLILWSKYKTKYKEMKKIKGKYENLFNISDMMFCGILYWYSIYFFDIENFEVINKIYIKKEFEIIGSINDNLFICTENINNLLIIDLKYFEIVQKIDTNKFDFVKIQKNYFISFLKRDELMRIQKHYYDSKEKQFEDRDISEVEVDFYISDNDIIITNNDYFIITNHNNLLVFNL